jgi:hypothetical protein
MNAGIGESKGEIIVRADAHTLYAHDYVRTCVDGLRQAAADNVGGCMNPVGTTSFGRAVAAVTTSRFGIGPGRFHYATARQEADTVYLGCWWRETLESLGGFDTTELQWGAEDHELNFRLRRAGRRVLLDPAIRSWYFPRETPGALARQYYNYGVGKASTLAKHRSLPSWRPLAPAVLVGASITLATCARGRARVAVPVAHAIACAWAAARAGRDPGVAPHRAFAAVEVCHWAYGSGFWAGVGRALTGRPYSVRPQGHR